MLKQIDDVVCSERDLMMLFVVNATIALWQTFPRSFILRALLLLLLVLTSHTLRAESFVLAGEPSLVLNSVVRFLEDPQGHHSIDSVRAEHVQWQRQGSSAFNQGYSASVWWLHLKLHNDLAHPLERYLELSYAVLDYVDVYVFQGEHPLQSHMLGDMLPFHQRPIENRFFVIPLQWQAGQTLDVYYRIKSSTAIQAPLTLWERDAFESSQNAGNIAQGLYYGAMVVIAVYNLLIFLVLWERSYLFYVLFVLSLPLFVASISGQAYHYLWPEAVLWNDHAIPFFLGLAFASSALFARRFLQVKNWSEWMHKGLTFIVLAAFGCVLMSFAVPYSVSIHLLVPLGLFACVFEMLVGVMAWYRGVHNARYYVVAWLMFLLGGVMLALNKLNVLPTNILTEYSLQIGSVLEAVLLSFAMAERINVERRLRFEAQSDALTATRRLNDELEQRVRERTQALEVANARLEALSNTDQLTQLKNRRYLEKVMEGEWLRCKRYQHEFAVVMMDVDYFKQVNDRYGHPAGDACLKQVAEQISRSVRWPTDQVVRYGGEEFCMILPETSGEEALIVAERIREQVQAGPIVTATETFSVTMSLGVCAGIPRDELSADTMLQLADMALYESKQGGRNRVTLLQPHSAQDIAALLNRSPRDAG